MKSLIIRNAKIKYFILNTLNWLSVNKVNNQLEIDFNCPKNSSVKRIILTDDSSVRFPHIYYQSKSLTYRFNHVHIIYL